MDWLQNLPHEAVEKVSKEIDLDPDLIYSLIMTESGGNKFAIRYEPQYRYTLGTNFLRMLADQQKISVNTIEMLQRCSVGYTQVMMAVIWDELHFRGSAIEAFDPETNIWLGATWLKNKIRKYGEHDGVSAYNAGSPVRTPGGLLCNELYVDRFYSYLRQLRAT